MINLMYLVLTALLALNVSSEILNAFKVVTTSLDNSNGNISKANDVLYKSLAEKANDPKTAEKATIWNNNAQKAKTLSDAFSTYIEDLKKQLKTEAGSKIVEGKDVFKEDDLEAATRLFGNGPGGKNLGPQFEQKLKDYRAAMLAISPEIGKEFENSLSVDGKPATGQDGTVKPFTEAYFHMVPTLAGLTLLSKFQNNVKNSENQVTTFCHNQIGQVVVHMDQVGVLVGQSSNYLMPGQELTVTAGVGAYSSAAKPSISIGGSSVAVTAGQGSYKKIVGGAGEQSIGVSVTFTDENGKPQTRTETVKYTVGTPGGAAVMLDKMNVFYIGVDNPVTIGSSTGWDKTTVSMSGGTISGSGSNRTVRVSAIGAANITVSADGKSSSFPFRVKRIPDPSFKVGSGKGRMATVEFKGQQFCRADLLGFDFDLRYTVVSATVYFFGAGFPSAATGSITSNSLGSISSLMQRCMPGSSIAFTNIKVSGPDGTRSIDDAVIQLY
ncbi:MAG: gliding motility protein GldM [Ferruginibacter sp.]|nr:gliding motility protein GldM [Ferruginibacter sp.]